MNNDASSPAHDTILLPLLTDRRTTLKMNHHNIFPSARGTDFTSEGCLYSWHASTPPRFTLFLQQRMVVLHDSRDLGARRGSGAPAPEGADSTLVEYDVACALVIHPHKSLRFLTSSPPRS